MDKLKQWVALALVGSLAVVAAGWFLLVSPKRGEAAELREQTAAQDAVNATLRTKLDVLKAQAKDLPKKQADLARVAAKIPSDPALPALIRALTTASTSAGVQLVSVTPAPPVAVAAPAAAAPEAPAAGEAPADTAAAPAAAAGSLATVPLVINVVGGYFEVAQFLSSLETLPRALRVTNLVMAPGTSPTAIKSDSETEVVDGRTLTTTITGEVYMATNRAAATPVVAPAVAPAK